MSKPKLEVDVKYDGFGNSLIPTFLQQATIKDTETGETYKGSGRTESEAIHKAEQSYQVNNRNK